MIRRKRLIVKDEDIRGEEMRNVWREVDEK